VLTRTLRRRRSAAVAVVAAAFALAAEATIVGASFSACAAPRRTTIGVVAMIEGQNAGSGKEMTNAAALAVKRVNNAGGLRIGKERVNVVLAVENDPNTPEGAMDAARRILSRDGVAAIVGPQFSGNAIPVARLAESLRMVMIAPMSTNPLTTADKKYVFRIPFLDTFQGFVIARFARDSLHARRAAVLYDVAGVYNRSLAEEFRRVFRESGGTVPAFETYTTDRNTDFSAQLARIARASPDVLFLPNYAEDAKLQAHEARAQKIGAVLLGGDGWDRAFAEDPAFDGSYAVWQWDPSLQSDTAKAFVSAFRAAYGKAPEDVAATTWDAFSILFAAMESAGSTEPELIQRQLHAMGPIPGVTGRMDYSNGGDPRKNAVVARFKDGKGSISAVVEP